MSSTDRAIRIVAAPATTRLGKKQKRFNLLVKQIAQRKQALTEWAERAPEFERAMAEGRRQSAEHHRLLAELVRAADQRLSEPGLARRERDDLSEVIATLAWDLLQLGGFDDLKPIFTRYTGRDFDREAAAHQAAEARMMRETLEAHLGLDFDGADHRTVEELQAAAIEQLEALKREAEEDERLAEERRAQRKKSPRQAAAEAVRVAERTQADKALQAIYRALAIALHPDREQDPIERARKTELMTEVNAAYEAKDLLKLLELQLRFEQVDQARLDTIAEDRLDHFNKLLTEQLAQLKLELDAREAPWRSQLRVPRDKKLTPARVLTAIRDDIGGMTFTLIDVRADVEAFQQLATLKLWLRAKQQQHARRGG